MISISFSFSLIQGPGHTNHNRQLFTWFGTKNILWGTGKFMLESFCALVTYSNRVLAIHLRFIFFTSCKNNTWILSLCFMYLFPLTLSLARSLYFTIVSVSVCVCVCVRARIRPSSLLSSMNQWWNGIQAYKLGMFGADYVWILHEIVGEPWWHKTTHECSQKQLQEVSENLLIVSSHNSIVSNEISYSGLVSCSPSLDVCVFMFVKGIHTLFVTLTI